MLQAAAQRLTRGPPSPAPTSSDSAASRLSPGPSSEQRSARRLSRISPSDFDSVLSAGGTVRIRSREPEIGDPAGEEPAHTRQGSSRDLVHQDPEDTRPIRHYRDAAVSESREQDPIAPHEAGAANAPLGRTSFPQNASAATASTGPKMHHPNASSVSIVTFSRRSPNPRRRVQSDETIQEKRTFASTMRKTSRFFRRFGAGSEPEQEGAGAQHAPQPPTPTPPIPSVPSQYRETTSTSTPTRDRPATSPQALGVNATPRPPRTPPGRTSERSADLTAPEGAGPVFPSPSRHQRRRSVSMSSLDLRDSRSTSSDVGGSPSSTRSRPARSEDARLRVELRRWRIAIDGVMDDSSTMATPDPAIGLGGGISDSSLRPSDLAAAADSIPRRGSPARRNSTPPRPADSMRDLAPEIRLHSPTALGTEPAPETASQTDEDSERLDDAVEIRAVDRRESEASEAPSESLSEFLHRTGRSTPPPIPPERADPAQPPEGVDAESLTEGGAKESLSDSLAAFGALASSAAPATPRPKSRAGRSDVFEAYEALDDSELEEKAREVAQQIYDGEKSSVDSRKAAEWLGSFSRISQATLRHYLQLFDFTGLRLDVAFRRLCGKLYLKAETQQVDRIIAEFSLRYFEQNPQSLFGSSDVVHAVTYSILLLNTDLHVVESTTRMTRQQFVRNTLEAVRAQADMEDAQGTPALLFASPNGSAPSTPAADPSAGILSSPEALESHSSLSPSTQSRRTVKAAAGEDSPSSSSLQLPKSPPTMPRSTTSHSIRSTDSPARGSLRGESLVTLGSTLSHRSQENSLQALLRDMYAAVKARPIYQTSTGSASNLHLPEAGQSSLSLGPPSSPYATWSPHLQRRNSLRSSTSTVSGAGRTHSHKRSSVRGLGALLGASSLELVRSTSPTPSTATSLSDEHWGLSAGAAMLQQQGGTGSIGFANNLAQTIIKEQQEDDARSEASLAEITDEELALLGAPWAKEGILERKHFWETAGKRSKDKNWVQAFVVVSAGELRMFRFDGGGMGAGVGQALGGGDWSTTASTLGSLSLVHALTSAVPPPGYNRNRPHCFVFTLPDGGSYFFQAGTPDLVAEWVATCNYWSARLSREPLAGGVSNMEYGWNRVDVAVPSDAADEHAEVTSIRSGHSRRSLASVAFRHSAAPSDGDRLHIHEWTPPQHALVPSQLSEDAQLEALRRHLAVLRKDAAQHDAVKLPMTRLYSPRSSNASKALSNWTRRAQHLEAERVKYSTYVEALSSAIKLRALHNGKKEVEHMLATADKVEPGEEAVTPTPAERPLPPVP